MQFNSRLISGLLALAMLIFLVTPFPGAAKVLEACVWIAIGLTCIWFAEPLGRWTGQIGYARRIDQETPPVLIAVFGWIVLLVAPGLLTLMR